MSLPLIPVDGREDLPCRLRVQFTKPSCTRKKNWCVFLKEFVTNSVCEVCSDREPGIMEVVNNKG